MIQNCKLFIVITWVLAKFETWYNDLQKGLDLLLYFDFLIVVLAKF